jgi:hypothetical protein
MTSPSAPLRYIPTRSLVNRSVGPFLALLYIPSITRLRYVYLSTVDGTANSAQVLRPENVHMISYYLSAKILS